MGTTSLNPFGVKGVINVSHLPKQRESWFPCLNHEPHPMLSSPGSPLIPLDGSLDTPGVLQEQIML